MFTWGSFVRLIRRRIVLGIIFGLSLTYCAISLLAHEKIGSVTRFNADPIENIHDDDEMPGKNFPWPDLSLTDDSNDSPDITPSIDTEFAPWNCRNSIQGRALIVDDRGIVCSRRDVLPTGCCREEQENTLQTGEKSIIKKERYSCETCNPQGCCAVYEYCVSCCLRSAKKRPKKDTPVRRETKSKKVEDVVKLRFRTLDLFQVCLAVCRTSSASVRHENTYKNPHAKYCYVTSPPGNNPPQRTERELINNKGDNDAITSSSIAMLFNLEPSLSCPNVLSCSIKS